VRRRAARVRVRQRSSRRTVGSRGWIATREAKQRDSTWVRRRNPSSSRCSPDFERTGVRGELQTAAWRPVREGELVAIEPMQQELPISRRRQPLTRTREYTCCAADPATSEIVTTWARCIGSTDPIAALARRALCAKSSHGFVGLRLAYRSCFRTTAARRRPCSSMAALSSKGL
jgi:hypothetical protein